VGPSQGKKGPGQEGGGGRCRLLAFETRQDRKMEKKKGPSAEKTGRATEASRSNAGSKENQTRRKSSRLLRWSKGDL